MGAIDYSDSTVDSSVAHISRSGWPTVLQKFIQITSFTAAIGRRLTGVPTMITAIIVRNVILLQTIYNNLISHPVHSLLMHTSKKSRNVIGRNRITWLTSEVTVGLYLLGWICWTESAGLNLLSSASLRTTVRWSQPTVGNWRTASCLLFLYCCRRIKVDHSK